MGKISPEALHRILTDIFKKGLISFDETKAKGEIGERRIIETLNREDVQELCYMRILDNIYIFKGKYSTEVDAVLLSEKGIFIIESKNYGGWVFGSENSEKWMQTFPSGKRHQFYNPVKQNNSHMEKVAEYLGTNTKKLFSYVIFSNRCELKKIPADSAHTRIFQLEKLRKIIRHDLYYLPQILTKEEVDEYYEKLQPLMFVEEDEKERHIEYVKKFTEGQECPVCGNELVLIDYVDGCSKYICNNCGFERTDALDVPSLRKDYYYSFRPRYYKHKTYCYNNPIWDVDEIVFKGGYHRPYTKIKPYKVTAPHIGGKYSMFGKAISSMAFGKTYTGSHYKSHRKSGGFDMFGGWW